MKLLISSIESGIVEEMLLKSIYGEDMIQTVYLSESEFSYKGFMEVYKPIGYIDEIFIVGLDIVSSLEELYRMTGNLGYYEDDTISDKPIMVNSLCSNIKVNIVYNVYYQNMDKEIIGLMSNCKFLTWNFIIDNIHEDDYVLLMLHSDTIDSLSVDTVSILKRVAHFILDDTKDCDVYSFYHKVSIVENDNNLYKEVLMNNDFIQCFRNNMSFIISTKDIEPSLAISKAAEVLQSMISVPQAKRNSIEWNFVHLLTNNIEILYAKTIRYFIREIALIDASKHV